MDTPPSVFAACVCASAQAPARHAPTRKATQNAKYVALPKGGKILEGRRRDEEKRKYNENENPMRNFLKRNRQCCSKHVVSHLCFWKQPEQAVGAGRRPYHGAHTSSDRLRGSLRSGDTGDRALPKSGGTSNVGYDAMNQNRLDTMARSRLRCRGGIRTD